MKTLRVALGQRLSDRLLRGRLLEWWLRPKMRRLEGNYAAQLVQRSRGKPASEVMPQLKSGSPLRRLLFISDIMWESDELVPELEKICPVETLNLNPRLRQRAKGQPACQTVAAVVEEFIKSKITLEPDLILFYARSSLLSEEVFSLLRKRWSCPVLGLNLDEKTQFLDHRIFSGNDDNYQRWARHFDLNLSNVRAVVDWYADLGLPVCYLPEGYHPRPGGPASSLGGFRHEISFVGSKRSERVEFFGRLGELGVPIATLGHGWPNSGRIDDPVSVYRTSMMNLGIGFAAPSRTLTTLKARDFECPGAGACYLTTYNWELAPLYELGREILCYRSEAELVEIFSFYRRRPEACLEIARAAYRRCLAEHTWEQRFRKVFLGIGFRL